MSAKSSLMTAASLSALLMLASCADDGAGRDAAYGLTVVADLNHLDGTTLVADGIVDPDRALAPDTAIEMSFSADAVSVNAGCNILNGAASIEDYELVVGELASTRMACDGALEEQDQWLMSFLTSRPRFERVDDDFYLSHDETVIHLVAADG